jgi:Spy/CpxP family protein refolding chaperone
MSIRRIAAAALVTGTLVVGAAAPAFARQGADDGPGHVRQEHRHGQVEVERHHQGGHR